MKCKLGKYETNVNFVQGAASYQDPFDAYRQEFYCPVNMSPQGNVAKKTEVKDLPVYHDARTFETKYTASTTIYTLY